ncbi:portal protein [Sphingomonas sp. Leaf24]|uniref:phage portal protein n=1 Tax=unclassified Sphingomonas TaxID=196159 RepID=UPI0006F5E6B3|nr:MULTISPECIES: phage portal protein [unclassified Sphingomonas]KQM14566.1 portal protein [Sphingomonas sp. Leaf5]KQM87867.1 portal protein [Sphingomonas sp. Leaf24]
MKWFGRRSGRDGSRPVLARGGAGAVLWREGSGPAAGGWAQGYEAQVRAAYLGNPIAQRAVRLVAEGVASMPVVGDARAVALVAARSAGQELLESVGAQLLLHGNAYIQLIEDGAGGIGELYALRPERVTVEADAAGWPVAYRYRVGDRVTRIAAEDGAGRPMVVHIRGFHPLDDHYGLGCLGAAAGAVAIHNEAARWNKALLDNAARPSGALVHDPGDGGVLSGEQYDRLRAQMDDAFAGAANAGRPMLLDGGLKWQAMSLTPADMDFVGLKAQAAREIALAFGVPPMLLGLPGDNTFANYREANRALWRQTIVPLGERVLCALGQAIDGWIGSGALRVDLDRVVALSDERDQLWARVAGADFLTPEEKRTLVGL